MKDLKRVVIIGGGIGGLTLALALRKKGVEVKVFEKYDHFQHHRTGFLIWSYAIKVLQGLDVTVDQVGAPLEFFEVHGRKGQPLTEMPIGTVSREMGADSYEINRRALIEMMSEMVGPDLVAGKNCISVESFAGHAVAHFEDGTSAEGDVVIGCDGANSTVRKFIHEDVELKMLNAGGWIAVLDQHPPDLKPNRHMDFWEPGIKAGVADIGNGQARWYVGMNGALPSADRSIREQIFEAVPVLPPVLQQCLDLTEEKEIVSVTGGDLLALEPWFKSRVMIMGDAAHATSPYAGMGACAAIADAGRLAELTDDCSDITEMFQRFQDERKPLTDAIIKESRHSLHMSTGRCRIENWFRDLKMQHIPDEAMQKIVGDMVNGK